MRGHLFRFTYFCVLSLASPGQAQSTAKDCEVAIAALQTSWWAKIKNKIWGLKYLEDTSFYRLDVDFVDQFLEHIRIGYDSDHTSAISERRWNGIWTKFNGNLWDFKYSDDPKIYGLEELISEMPEESGFRPFARKALHLKSNPEPIAYLVGWEQLFTRRVDWAFHIVFVDGTSQWIFGSNLRGNKQALADFI